MATVPTQVCGNPGCDAEFIPTKRTQFYCSDACRLAAWQLRNASRGLDRRIESLELTVLELQRRVEHLEARNPEARREEMMRR